jgi:hypothetical protein
MSQVTSSHFAKYFCDTYFEYITPCMVMTYAMSDPTRVTEKISEPFSYLEEWMNFHIIYYQLYMLIMHVYHDSGHMPDSYRKARLLSFARIRLEDTIPVVCPTPVWGRDSGRMTDSGWKIWLQSYNSRHTSQFWSTSRLQSCIVASDDERSTCLTTTYVKKFAWPG